MIVRVELSTVSGCTVWWYLVMMFIVVCCLALWLVFSVMWSDLLMTSAISCALWSSVYKCQRVECVFTSPVRTECGTVYSVICPYQLFCSAWMCCLEEVYKCLQLCNCGMFSVVVNAFLDHLKFCVFMVEGMSVVVNIMLSLMSVMSPPPALCNISARTVVNLCTLSVFALRVSFVSWIVMISACVSWISSLSSPSLFLIPFMLTCSIMRFLSLLLLGLCPCVVSVVMWSVCEVVVVPYVDVVVAVTVMCVLLFVLHAERVWGWRVTVMLVWGGWGVVVVSAGHVCGTRG